MRISPSLTENCFPCVLIVAFISSKGRNKVSRVRVIKDLFTFPTETLRRRKFCSASGALRAAFSFITLPHASHHGARRIPRNQHRGLGEVTAGQGLSADDG